MEYQIATEPSIRPSANKSDYIFTGYQVFVMSALNRKIRIHLQRFVMEPSTVNHDFSAWS